MKSFLRVVKWVGLTLVVLVVGFVAFVYARANRTYDAPYPDLAASQDSTLIERGRYLATGPAHCVDCHTPTSEVERLAAGEDVPMSGGFDFVLPIGTIYAPNITPDPETGIGAYTDGELARALRYGVKRDGRPLLDFMPFYDLSDYDLTAVISYLRASEPVQNERPAHEFNFMGNMVRALGMVKPMGDGDVPPAPAIDTTAAYGEYLARTVANCRGCHSERDLRTGAYVGPEYAGQMEFEGMEGGYFVTPNLTPDPETGRIANWSQDQFVQRLRSGVGLPGSPMPWGPFSRMSDTELIALFKFFSTLDPVRAEKPIPVGLQGAS